MATSFTAGVGPSVVIQKPATNWGELSSPFETTANKVSRYFGQFLVVLGICSGGLRQLAAARMTASPDTIIRTCATLQVVMIVSLVAGAVLWFFNRLTQDPSSLLTQRREVQNQIEKTALAELRTKYQSPFVLSDAELNQWIRYLAGSAPFNDFMTKQSDRIFNLPLEDETRKLLKGQYARYVQDAALPFKNFIAQKPFQILLSDPERADAKNCVANREAARASVYTADSYRTFISEQGVAIISHLDTKNLQAVVQGFCNDAKESGVGILDLKKNRAEELKAFGPKTEEWLFQEVVTREGLQPYETFRTRNGDEAIGYITDPKVKEGLLKSLSDFVVGKKDGLVKTRKDFERTIVMFSDGAAEIIYTRVLTDEIDALTRGEFTYLDFRRRNGIKDIRLSTQGNKNLIGRLKECFLRLSASDLIGPVYTEDRILLEIATQDVREELERRWNEMTFAEILRTDREGFVAVVAGPYRCFNPQKWTQKAVDDTVAMSINYIIHNFGVLFETRVLTADNGNFKDRLAKEIAPIAEWTALINAYGAFVFEQRLLDFTQVGNLVGNFIRTYAESYLNDSFEEAMSKYVQVIEKYCNSVLTQTIKEAKADFAAEKQRYAVGLQCHEADFKVTKQVRQKDAAREIAQFQSDQQMTRKEKAKTTAHHEWSEKKAAYEALDRGVKACREDIDRSQETYHQKCTALRELQTKQANIPANLEWQCAQAERAAQQARRNVQQAEPLVSNQFFQPRLVVLKKDEEELTKTLQKIEALQQERKMLSDEVNNFAFAERKEELQEKIAHPDKPVRGHKAAQEAKKEAKEAPKLLAEMKAKEARLAEVTRQLDQTNYQYDKKRLGELRSEKAGIESLLAQQEAKAQLPQLRAEEKHALDVLGQWRASEGESQSLSQQITSRSGEIEQLRRQIDIKTGVLGEKKAQCEKSRLGCEAAAARKQSTEIAYNISVQQLTQKTAEIRLVCAAKIEEMGIQKAQLLSEVQCQHTEALQGIVTKFKSLI